MQNITVFASGSGTNFQSIISSIQSGALSARLVGLISNKDNIGAIERASNSQIPSVIISPNEFLSPKQYEDSLLEQLDSWETHIIVLAGYLKKIPVVVLQKFPNRILNIHPSLLPKYGGKGFFGLKVHSSVIEAGEKESGCTVHIVTEKYDDGPILGQAKVPVLENDTPVELAKRVLEQEHILYPKIIQQHLESLRKNERGT